MKFKTVQTVAIISSLLVFGCSKPSQLESTTSLDSSTPFAIENGVCGSANSQTLGAAPTSNLCSAGIATSISGAGPWTWGCSGRDGGTSASCSASLKTFTVTPSGSNLSMSPSSVQTVNANATKSFTVTASSGYTRSSSVGGTCPSGSWSGSVYTTGAILTNCTVQFSATQNPIMVNGACGSANGQTVGSAPTVNLCSSGTASGVAGAGPWTWSCAGSNGGSTAQCSASKTQTSTPPPTGAVTSLGFANQLSSAISNRYVTFGQAFVAGQVSANQALVARAGSQDILLQVDKKTTWTDGSLKFAVVTAKLESLGANQTLDSNIFAASSAPAGAALTPTDVMSVAGYDFVVSINMAGQTFSASARSALQTAMNSGSVETYLSGPLASEFHVMSNLTANLGAEFDIRIYANREIRTEVTLTNNRGFVSGMMDRTYDVTLTQGGQVVYTKAALKHVPYSSWHKNFMYGGSAMNVFIKHNRAYYAQTRLVPNYNPGAAPAESFLQANKMDLNSAACGPMGVGTITQYMPSTGGRLDIGFLPTWDAVYFASMDPRAQDWVLCNATAAASIPYHIAEAKGSPFRLIERPTLFIDGRGDIYPDKLATTYSTGSSPFAPDTAHMPNLGYSAYLITGDRVYLQEMLFQAAAVIGMSWPDPRQNGKGIVIHEAFEVRAGAWNVRTVALAADLAPDNDSHKAYLLTILDNNLTVLNNLFTSDSGISSQGEIHGYFRGVARGNLLSPWQSDYLASVLGQMANRGYPKALSAIKGQANFIAGRYLHMCATLGAPYTIALENSSGALIKTWAELASVNFGSSCPSTIDTSGGDYAMYTAPALAPMIDNGIANAQQVLDFLKTNDPHWNPSAPAGAYYYPMQMNEDIAWSVLPLK